MERTTAGPLRIPAHRGQPDPVDYDLFRSSMTSFRRRVEGLRVTGSGSRTIAKILGHLLRKRIQGDRPHDAARSIRRSARSSKSAARARNISGWTQTKAPGSSTTTAAASAPPARARSSTSRRCGWGTRGGSRDVVCERGLRGADRRTLLGVRQERHDPRPAEGLHPGRDSSRPVRRRGPQFQERAS